MARPNITFQSIGLRARERVDMVNSSFISPSEEMTLIESAWKEFLLIVYGRFEDIFLKKKDLTTVAGVEYVSLDDVSTDQDYFKLRRVCLVENGVLSSPLRRIDPSEETRVSDGRRGKPFAYSIHSSPASPTPGNEPLLYLYPTPDRAYTVLVSYVPFRSLRDWLVGGQHFYFLAGWDEIMVVSVAIKMKDKEEGDCSVLLVEKQSLIEGMLKTLTPYDESEPAAVVQRTPQLSIYDDPFSIEDRFSGIF